MEGMAGGQDHAGHNHSAHAFAPPPPHNHSAHAPHDSSGGGMDTHSGGGMDMHMGTGVVRLPGGGYTYSHGAWTGHVVPGTFFLVWGLWWTITTYTTYIQCLAARRPFRTKGWRLLPFGPSCLRSLPLEPFVKLVLPAIGILGELWLGHESWRNLYDSSTGRFFSDNLNDWQHSTMYLSFLTSGVVDLLGHYCGAPPGADLAFLALSFLAEGLLLIFHLKGPRVEVLVHLILGLQVFATVVAILGEIAAPTSILAASARPWLTMVQGIWWIVTAQIMYTNAPQWDPDYMGSGMFVPVPFVAWSLGTAFAMLCMLLLIKAIAERRLGRPLSLDPHADEALQLQHPQHHLLGSADDEEGGSPVLGNGGYVGGGGGRGGGGGGRGVDRDLEMSGLVLKTYASPAMGHSGHAS